MINGYRFVSGKRYIDNVGSQKCLIYEPMNGLLTQANTDKVFTWSQKIYIHKKLKQLTIVLHLKYPVIVIEE